VIICPESWDRFRPRAELEAIIGQLGEDEVRVLTRIAGRLLHGLELYGCLDLAQDARDFRREAQEEIEDYLVYFACQSLRRAARAQ
jgi:hypothetical protein